MSIFEKIKYYYDKKIYKKSHIAAIVKAGKLTPEEYKEITGEDYSSVIQDK